MLLKQSKRVAADCFAISNPNPWQRNAIAAEEAAKLKAAEEAANAIAVKEAHRRQEAPERPANPSLTLTLTPTLIRRYLTLTLTLTLNP